MGRKCHRFGGWNKWVTAEHCGNYTCCSHGSKVINLGANLSNFDSSQIGCFVLTGIELLVIGNWYGNSLVLLLHNYCLALISPCLSAASGLLHAWAPSFAEEWQRELKTIQSSANTPTSGLHHEGRWKNSWRWLDLAWAWNNQPPTITTILHLVTQDSSQRNICLLIPINLVS